MGQVDRLRSDQVVPSAESKRSAGGLIAHRHLDRIRPWTASGLDARAVTCGLAGPDFADVVHVDGDTPAAAGICWTPAGYPLPSRTDGSGGGSYRGYRAGRAGLLALLPNSVAAWCASAPPDLLHDLVHGLHESVGVPPVPGLARRRGHALG